MIYIFHGEDIERSRGAYLEFLDSQKNFDILRIDSKSIDLDNINNFLCGTSLFADNKILAIGNFFSIPKSNLDKLISIIKNSDISIVIWQDKKINITQSKIFPQANIQYFKLDNQLFSCINNIKPGNYENFAKSFQKVIDKNLYDLFLYFLKNSFRKSLQTYSKFPVEKLKASYLQLIELEYLTKTGNISSPKEILLQRIIYHLLQK